MYKNYIFDLYGTLVDIRTNENKNYLWDKMTEMFGFYGAFYDKGELKKKYFSYIKETEAEHEKEEEYAEIDLAQIFLRLFEEKGISADNATIIACMKMFRVVSTKYVRLYDGVIDFMEDLKKSGKKVYLLSNAQREFTRPEIGYLGLEKYFDGILISSEEGCKKPGRRFYQTVLERYHLNPKESIMIGNDSIADIQGAYEAGLDSLYIHTEISPDCVEDLKSTYTIMDGDFTKVKDLILK